MYKYIETQTSVWSFKSKLLIVENLAKEDDTVVSHANKFTLIFDKTLLH